MIIQPLHIVGNRLMQGFRCHAHKLSLPPSQHRAFPSDRTNIRRRRQDLTHKGATPKLYEDEALSMNNAGIGLGVPKVGIWAAPKPSAGLYSWG